MSISLLPTPRANITLPSSVDKSTLEARLWSSLNIPLTQLAGLPSLSDMLDGYEPALPIDSTGTSLSNSGSVTIPAAFAGAIKVAAGQQGNFTINNPAVQAGSICVANINGTTIDATATSVQTSCAAGAITLKLNAAATGAVVINWILVA